MMWTKRGIVRLGFLLNSPRAKAFRDFAEDLVLSDLPVVTAPAPLALPGPRRRATLRRTPFSRRFMSDLKWLEDNDPGALGDLALLAGRLTGSLRRSA